ncbi:hypothetical protein CBM2587_A30095 [Cupriavidus taiwanensis]|uniref:Uncharacterized protein n=1 Tax=Cupriavidus taiwanensis TaxID=164546 RepID=A0A975X268_9BURK|nr:hypothetical protein CBM2587_A30095 [Cupriavidus taiwanensis]
MVVFSDFCSDSCSVRPTMSTPEPAVKPIRIVTGCAGHSPCAWTGRLTVLTAAAHSAATRAAERKDKRGSRRDEFGIGGTVGGCQQGSGPELWTGTLAGVWAPGQRNKIARFLPKPND